MTTPTSRLLTATLLGLSTLVLAGCGRGNLFDRVGNFWTWGCCSAIIVIVDIIFLVELAGSNKPLSHKVLWAFLIIVFPILGAAAYYFIGR